MSCKLRDLLNIIEEMAPQALQEDWDNNGLMIGSLDAPVDGLYLDLDLTLQTIRSAKEAGIHTILTHHPILFSPLRSLNTDQPPGSVIREALLSGMNVLAAHTNLDHAQGGVNDALSARLGLDERIPVPDGIGRIAVVEEESAGAWLERIAQRLRCRPKFVGNPEKPIRRIGLCGGAGGELVEQAHLHALDLVLTAEVKHHQALLAEETGLFVVDAGHYETEYPVLGELAARLEKRIDMPVHVAPFVPPFRFETEGNQ